MLQFSFTGKGNARMGPSGGVRNAGTWRGTVPPRGGFASVSQGKAG